MNTGRSIQQEWQKPDDELLAKASLEHLIPYAKTGHFLRDSIVCTGDQLGECIYFVLKGQCEHRRKSRDAGTKVIQTFEVGETFGGLIDGLSDRLSSEVVAVQDSVVLAVRKSDLANVEAKPDGENVLASGKIPSSNTTFFFSAPKNRVINLVFLCDAMPAQTISESVASQLRAQTGEPVILVEFTTDAASSSSASGEFDHELDGAATLPGDIHRDEASLHRLRLKLSADPPDPEVVGDLFRKLRRRFRFVLVSVRAEKIPSAYLVACIFQSNTTYFFFRPSSDDLYRLDLLLHEIRTQRNSPVEVEIKPVLCLAHNETVGDFDWQILNTGISAPLFIHDCPLLAESGEPASADATKGLFRADIRRLARDIGDCLVGLALSSGGAKGFAHIGVIQVLEENGLDVDIVAGASMGAYVGAIWACGHDGSKMEALAREMEMKRAMWTLIDPVIVPWQGFLRGYAVKRRLQRSIGAAQFADLARPLRVVAAKLDTMERMVFSTGDVATAVHASIAVPGICIPVRIDEEVYVDGGIVDPVPTDVLQEMGVSKIIAVNTIPTPERIRQCLQAQHELARLNPKKSRSFIRKLLPPNLYINHYTDGNVLEILMHSTHGAQMRLAEASSRRADIVLHPDICDDRWMDFRNPGLYIKAGREVALQHLGEIKSLIKEKGAFHELEQAPKALAKSF